MHHAIEVARDPVDDPVTTFQFSELGASPL